MSTPILKPDKDRDLYVLWSTVVDNVVGLGSRQQIVAFWREEYGRSSLDSLALALDRADETGSSSYRSFGTWDDERLLTATDDGFFWLPRRHLEAYALAQVMGAAADQAVTLSLLEPWEPEGDGPSEDQAYARLRIGP